MKKLLDGLQAFQSGYFNSNRELFEELAHGQKPRILFIACSDSRIDPNLITQARVGELFVIRNAGNMIPPYGATNGGEGAAVEYAIQALEIEQIIVCGHSHCGAMKGLLKLQSLSDQMPLVYNWLKQAEATRRLVKENYQDLEGEDLLEVTVAENVLSQLENLHTYPIIRSRLHKGTLSLHAWIYRIETGEVLAYDSVLHDFVAPQSILPSPEHEYNLHPSCRVPVQQSFKVPDAASLTSTHAETKSTHAETKIPVPSTSIPGMSHLSAEQAERIYRGSNGSR